MRLITRQSLAATPWKNGGGITRQIAAAPPDSGLADFDWRLSSADVAKDGAFSRFEGVDRELHILEGAGLELRFGDGSTASLTPGAHIAFAGEAAVEGRLIDGPVTDLNIMVRRERWHFWSRTAAVVGGAAIALPWPVAAVFVIDGRIEAGDEGKAVAERHDTLLFEGDHPRQVSVTGRATLLVIGFAPR